jgi:arsenate reductase-like glutaredoxin family protein
MAAGGRPGVAAARTPAVQIFGRRDSRDTQKALRFFKERRVPVSFVDVATRPPAPGELRRFRERLGAAALLDSDGALYRERGIAYLRMNDDEMVARVLEEPRLLRLPLVRFGSDVSVGLAERLWAGWLSRPEGPDERDRAR